jgi:hypothetical protein
MPRSDVRPGGGLITSSTVATTALRHSAPTPTTAMAQRSLLRPLDGCNRPYCAAASGVVHRDGTLKTSSRSVVADPGTIFSPARPSKWLRGGRVRRTPVDGLPDDHAKPTAALDTEASRHFPPISRQDREHRPRVGPRPAGEVAEVGRWAPVTAPHFKRRSLQGTLRWPVLLTPMFCVSWGSRWLLLRPHQVVDAAWAQRRGGRFSRRPFRT